MTAFMVYDVFTETAFGGNQLAVIPDAAGLAEADLQRIAREFNFSETTFVFPPDDPAHTAKVRIFTPVNEIPFAGHPTIGTAIALAQTGRGTNMVLELGVGPIPCKVNKGEVCTAEFTTTVPLDVIGELKTWLIAKCLGLAPEQIKSANHTPTMASCGLPFMLVELPDLKTLSSTAPDFEAFAMAEEAFSNQTDLFATYAYVRNGDTISTRMFAPLSNITEDPATGSAAAALGAFLTQQEQSPMSFDIHQGFDMGRPSYIGVQTTLENGVCSSVTITGAAIKTMEGHLTI